MQKQWTVAILGDSLFMAGLGASLCGQKTAQVLQIKGFRQDLPAHLTMLRPDVILFDLDTLDARLLFDLLTGFSGLLFLGLGVAGNKAVTFSSHAHAAMSVGDLVELIEQEVGQLESVPVRSGGI
ncbi:MAG: hypothetical protein H5T69_17220 [Chloroflexi bacterium]|nr:hypothetical protein [Chloroflexota bacterium]